MYSVRLCSNNNRENGFNPITIERISVSLKARGMKKNSVEFITIIKPSIFNALELILLSNYLNVCRMNEQKNYVKISINEIGNRVLYR